MPNACSCQSRCSSQAKLEATEQAAAHLWRGLCLGRTDSFSCIALNTVKRYLPSCSSGLHEVHARAQQTSFGSSLLLQCNQSYFSLSTDNHSAFTSQSLRSKEHSYITRALFKLLQASTDRDTAEARWMTLNKKSTGPAMVDQVSVLPLELWARVFKELEPTPGTPEWDWCPVMLKAQTSFWQLPLVCKGFCSVFRTHLELGHHILLNKKKLRSGNQRVAASLVPWLEARAAVVKTFHANHWSKDVVKYLTALKHQSSAMADIVLKPKHMTEVSCLASFTALTSCCLQSVYGKHCGTVDLTPLQGLQVLTKLALNRGWYCSLSAVSHLTDLDLNTAHISDSDYCDFASNLVHLKMQTSNLTMLHARGLMACVALQSLEISEHCTIGAVRGVDCLDTFKSVSGDIRISADFSPLACLTDLQLSLRNHGQPSQLFGLGTLPHLHSLHLIVPGPAHIGAAFEKLNKLTNLYVGTAKGNSFTSKDCISFSLDWQALHDLRQLEIRCLFSAGKSFMDIAKLLCLRCLKLEDAEPATRESAWYLGGLSRKVTSDHPKVLFECPRMFRSAC